MSRVSTILVVLAAASISGGTLSLAHIALVLQPIIVAVSIMAAALLIRLNRGMPTLDWKSLDATDRKTLTAKIVELSREYMTVLALQALTLGALLAVAASKDAVLPLAWERAVCGGVGALIGLCIARMAYIVWRDYDIIRLQKKLIDDAADKEARDAASKEALSNVAAIRASGLRAVGKPEASSWPE